MKDVRLLFVEDDPISAASLRGWLQLRGAQATHASGPAEADGELERNEFDVLLSDIHMPGNENLAWVERTARRFPALHVVLLTGSPRIDNAIKAANLHVAAFLVKPPDFSELEAVLSALQATTDARRRAKACIEDLRAKLSESTAGLDEASLVPPLRELNDLWPILETDPYTRGIAPVNDLRGAVRDAIHVIERTKDSFRSRELGELRQRLLRTLTD